MPHATHHIPRIFVQNAADGPAPAPVPAPNAAGGFFDKLSDPNLKFGDLLPSGDKTVSSPSSKPASKPASKLAKAKPPTKSATGPKVNPDP